MLAFLLLIEDDSEKEFLILVYKRYFAFIKKRLTDAIPADDVEDCIQDCFVRLVNNVHQFQKLSQQQITAYIYQTIRSVVVDYAKKKKLLIIDYDIDIAPDREDRSSVEKEIEGREAYEFLFKGFHTLPEVDQIILRGLYQDDMSRDELAKMLGIKPASIRTYISRAKKHALQLMRGKFDEK